jgi:RimJ/RimL family protein N-acetyltransferase
MAKNIWQGKIVRLRSFKLEDAEILAQLPQDTEADAFANRAQLPAEQTLESKQNYLQSQIKFTADEKDDSCQLAIEALDSNKLVGLVGMYKTNRRTRVAWLNIRVYSSAERGKGYGGEAILILLNYFFNELDYFRVTLNVFAPNIRAHNLYKKVGFVEEARLRQPSIYQGRREDEFLMGILKDEFNIKHRDFVEFLYSEH